MSGPGLVLFGATVTFASFDWVMSLEPHWFSTIFGLSFMVGQVLTAFPFAIAMTAYLSGRRPMSEAVTAAHFHDLGKLTLAFVMLWAYLSFSQFLIIWSGNLPEETPYYLKRLAGGWQYFQLALILFHFALPFFLLLSRSLKRSGAQARKGSLSHPLDALCGSVHANHSGRPSLGVACSHGWTWQRPSASAGCGWRLFSGNSKAGQYCRFATPTLRRPWKVDTKHGHGHEPPAGIHHETSDVHVRPLAWLGVGLAVLIVIIHSGHEGCIRVPGSAASPK